MKAENFVIICAVAGTFLFLGTGNFGSVAGFQLLFQCRISSQTLVAASKQEANKLVGGYPVSGCRNVHFCSRRDIGPYI